MLPEWLQNFTGATLLGMWAVSVLAAVAATWGVAWSSGFLRGVQWEKTRGKTWLGRERRRAHGWDGTDRRERRQAATDTAETPKAPF